MSYDLSRGSVGNRLPRTGRVLDIRLITVVHSSPIVSEDSILSTADRRAAELVTRATELYELNVDEMFKCGAGAIGQLFLGHRPIFPGFSLSFLPMRCSFLGTVNAGVR